MNLHDNIFCVLWEHLAHFEMNIMSMEYSKWLFKDVKWFENDIFYEKKIMYTFTL